MENKKIIHFQIPMNERGEFSITPQTIEIFAKLFQKNLGDEYALMFSPFKISASADVDGITIKDFEEKDLKQLIEWCEKQNKVGE